MKKSIRTLAVLAGLAALCACGDGGTTTPDGNTDACTNCGAAYEASFVVSKLQIGTTDQGFNLDGEDTQCTDGSCIPDGRNGVDNRLSGILGDVKNAIGGDFDANTSIAEQIDGGDMLVLFRLLDVNVDPMGSLTSTDSAVQLFGYIGADADDPKVATDNFSGTEPINIDSRSLKTAGNIEDPLIKFSNCSVNKGKFSCRPDKFQLDLVIEEKSLSLAIEQAQVQATIDRSPTKTGNDYLSGSMKEGTLGGYVPIRYLQDTLEQFASELGEQSIDPATIQNILANHADIDATPQGPTTVACPNGADDCLSWQTCRTGFCDEPANQNDAISLAVSFELTSILFTKNIVTVD